MWTKIETVWRRDGMRNLTDSRIYNLSVSTLSAATAPVLTQLCNSVDIKYVHKTESTTPNLSHAMYYPGSFGLRTLKHLLSRTLHTQNSYTESHRTIRSIIQDASNSGHRQFYF